MQEVEEDQKICYSRGEKTIKGHNEAIDYVERVHSRVLELRQLEASVEVDLEHVDRSVIIDSASIDDFEQFVLWYEDIQQ